MMILAYMVFGFTVTQLLVVLTNLIFLQLFPAANKEFQPLISVLIPARNEENNIANIIQDILNQDYQQFELLVFNDQSTDKTTDIVSSFAKNDNRIHLFHSKGLPNGWLGKNFGCHSLAQKAQGEYLFFIDADVRLNGSIITDTLAMTKKYDLGLLTIFPKQKMMSLGEYLTVPNMNFILLSLLPLILVRKSKFPSLAAANGQFMLFNAGTYRKNLPHQTFKNNKVEDIETARYFKTKNIKVACLAGDNNVCCRMYKGFEEAVNGFSKNVINFFGNSFLLATIFWLITTFGIVLVWVVLPIRLFGLYLALLILTRVFISIVSRQNIIINLLLSLPQQLTMGIFILKAAINKKNKTFQWKGRTIS